MVVHAHSNKTLQVIDGPRFIDWQSERQQELWKKSTHKNRPMETPRGLSNIVVIHDIGNSTFW